MNVIIKNRTNENRNFSLTVNGFVAGRVFAVYKTPTQFHWDGKVKIDTTAGVFIYEDEAAKSSKKFLVAAHEALNTFLLESDALLPVKEELTPEEEMDRRVQFIKNREDKAIPMSDLVKQVRLSEPKVTADDLKNYDDTQSVEDQAILAM